MGQGGALLLAFAALGELDGAKFAGIKGAKALRDGEDEIPQAQAQGPEIEGDGTIRATGVYRWTRHPLEWAPALLLLSSPMMKTNWLAFDVLAAIYSVAGALHEEKRLGRENPNYAKYQQETAFWMGKPQAKAFNAQNER